MKNPFSRTEAAPVYRPIEEIGSSSFYDNPYDDIFKRMEEAEAHLAEMERRRQIVTHLAQVVDFTRECATETFAAVAGELMGGRVSLPESDAEHIARCADWRVEEAKLHIQAINYSVRRHVEESQRQLPEELRLIVTEFNSPALYADAAPQTN